MYTHEYQLRVRYSETDKMAYVYYGNYTAYYEVGRVEAMRNLGFTYAQLEDELGIMMPVMSMNVRYLRPAFYDDLIVIETTIPHLPSETIKFNHRLFNTEKKLINAADITLCFVEIKNKKRITAPELIVDKLKSYFDNA